MSIRNYGMSFVLVLVLAAVTVFGGLAVIASGFVGPQPASASAGGTVPAAQTGDVAVRVGESLYSPPRLEDAPEKMVEPVQYGYNLLHQSQVYASAYVGNQLNCTNCHFNAGLAPGGKEGGISLVGVAAKYPIYRTRTEYSTSLETRVNECWQRSMNGKPLPNESKEMQAIIAYLAWISKDLPIYGEMPWLGLKQIESDHAPDAAAGQQVYAARCVACHGANGEGTPIAPPVWGDYSYNDGAGMARPTTLSAFSLANMPKGDPSLTEIEAIDVAEYVDTQPRPKYKK